MSQDKKEELGASASPTASPMLRTEPQASPPSGSVPTGADPVLPVIPDDIERAQIFWRDQIVKIMAGAAGSYREEGPIEENSLVQTLAAHRIAATGRLIEALEATYRRLSAVGQIGRDDQVLEQARAALSKAEGR